MYKYNYTGSLISRLIKVVDEPLQVEIQPGIHCGKFKCYYCYGKNQKLNRGLLSLEDFNKLFKDLNGKTQFLALGGITSDPLTYPDISDLIQLVIQYGFKFGISTKGHFLDDKTINVLSSAENYDCFINFSIDAPDSKIYNKVRDLKGNHDYFNEVRSQIKKLYEACIKRKSKLRIKASYLIFEINANESHFDTFISSFSDIVNEIRFSIPQYPNEVEPKGYVDKAEVPTVLKTLKKYENNENIIVLPFDFSEHDKTFHKCMTQKFNITIDKAGNVYPCPQVTTQAYSQLIYGNIKKTNIWDIWKSEKRRQLFDWDIDSEMKCRVCDRKDETINSDLNHLLD